MSVNTIVLPKANNKYPSGSSSQLEALIPVFQPAYLLTSIIPALHAPDTLDFFFFSFWTHHILFCLRTVLDIIPSALLL